MLQYLDSAKKIKKLELIFGGLITMERGQNICFEWLAIRANWNVSAKTKAVTSQDQKLILNMAEWLQIRRKS